MILEEIAEEVKKATGINVYARSIERIFSSLLVTSDFWLLVDYSGEPLPLVAKAIEVLEKKGYVKINSDIKLTEEGKKLVRELGIVEIRRLRCKCCEGRGISIDTLKDVYEKYMEIQKNRPEPIREYDQGYITPSSAISRVAFAMENNDIQNKDIIVLGDDDLLSIAIALTGKAKRIKVLEIDDRIVEFIKNVGEKYDLNIDVEKFDLREPLPEELVGSFDTFFCDPTETLAAFRAFVAKGIATLKSPRCAGYFGITRVESSLDKWKKMQKALLELGVVITDILPIFSEYENWGFTQETKAWRLSPVKELPKENWYRSWLYRIETLEGFKRLNEKISEEAFYSDEESSCV